MGQKKALIIGAGPAGLTAAYELLKKTDIKPCIYEMSGDIGGLAKTRLYKGNRLDVGGHRFFSKSTRVLEWWESFMPVQEKPALDDKVLGRQYSFPDKGEGADPEQVDLVMLIRRRISRYFFRRSFFEYPVSLTLKTIKKMGLIRICRIGMSYLRIKFFPIKEEKNLEDFLINRFGRELYYFFFKDYTEKVWGVPCSTIPSIWGAQRIKGLSLGKTIAHALRSRKSDPAALEQDDIETSLIEQFLYPKLGPGQLWEEVAGQIIVLGGEIHMNYRAESLDIAGDRIKAVTVVDTQTGEAATIECDYVFSTMPVKELISGLPENHVPEHVKEVANGLMYRDFITVGLLLDTLKVENDTGIRTMNNIIPDNWIYIQDKNVKLGRIQIYNNWSPYLVKNLDNVWVGLEYFCNEEDDFWGKTDREIIQFAIDELVAIDFIEAGDVLDATIIRELKSYPAYFGSYERFDEIRMYTDSIKNLFLIGRNGMHRYNNMDHSMMTAMVAVENIMNGIESKDTVWQVNTEENYHEEANN